MPAARPRPAELDSNLSRVGASSAEVSREELARDPGVLEGLSLEALIDLRRRHDHIRAELDASITRKFTEARRPEAGYTDIQVLTIDRLADLWGMKPAKVRELCRTGRIPALKLGRKEWAIPIAELRELVRKSRVAEEVPGGYTAIDATDRSQGHQKTPGAYRVEVRRARGLPSNDRPAVGGGTETPERDRRAPHAATRPAAYESPER